jgi:hypothetical protein
MNLLALRNRAMQLAAAAMSLYAACGPAGAFTVSEVPLGVGADQPTIAVYNQGVDMPKIDQVYCRWGCRGWGWRGPAFVGGLAAGALVGGALAAPYYYGGGPYYGYGGPYYGYGGPYGGGYNPGCWRSVWTAYGWRRVWAC